MPVTRRNLRKPDSLDAPVSPSVLVIRPGGGNHPEMHLNSLALTVLWASSYSCVVADDPSGIKPVRNVAIIGELCSVTVGHNQHAF